jgi:hypothetical protein
MAGSNQQQPSQQDQPRQRRASTSCSTPKQAHPRHSQPRRVRGGFGMSRSYSQLCVPGPDGSQQYHPITAPTWIATEGSRHLTTTSLGVDVQTVTIIDAWAGQRNERGSPDKPGLSLRQGDGSGEQAAAGGHRAELSRSELGRQQHFIAGTARREHRCRIQPEVTPTETRSSPPSAGSFRSMATSVRDTESAMSLASPGRSALTSQMTR